jgi:hypothetical protein
VTTPKVQVARFQNKKGKSAKVSVPPHNIFYDTNAQDNTNILEVDMSGGQDPDFVDID